MPLSFWLLLYALRMSTWRKRLWIISKYDVFIRPGQLGVVQATKVLIPTGTQETKPNAIFFWENRNRPNEPESELRKYHILH